MTYPPGSLFEMRPQFRGVLKVFQSYSQMRKQPMKLFLVVSSNKGADGRGFHWGAVTQLHHSVSIVFCLTNLDAANLGIGDNVGKYELQDSTTPASASL